MATQINFEQKEAPRQTVFQPCPAQQDFPCHYIE